VLALAVPGAARALPTDPPTPATPPSVARTIAAVQAKPAYRHSLWGIEVRDLATGQVLIARNSQQLYVPGSIFKTFSVANVLHHLGIRHRFRTPVHRLGTVRNGTLRGNLALVASGDFSFGLRDRKNGTLGFNSFPQIDHNYADTGLPGPTLLPHSHPLAGVNDLARQVRRSGIRRVRGNVVVDGRMFQPATQWPDGLISPMWLNENVLDMRGFPTRPGRRAKLRWRPHTAQWRVINRVRTGRRGAAPGLQVAQTRPGVVTLRGTVPAGKGPVLQIFQIPNPDAFARAAFIAALRRHGVEVSASARSANPAWLLPRRFAYPRSTRVAQHVSPPLEQYTKVILKVSYNRGADLLLCLAAARLGSRNCEAGLRAELRNNAALGVPNSSTFAFDGAGSDDRSRTSPADMTQLLRAVTSRPYGAALRRGLPIVGVDGTLATVGKGKPFAGKIQAKTGNRLAFVSSRLPGLLGGDTHVGYITAASGRQLVYADLLSNTPLAQPSDVGDVEADLTAIEGAIQQAY
jgi:serine-type D-Ala-D-Ala carboxypeptidase/endopeptidase (penicillin-binding protein 4)